MPDHATLIGHVVIFSMQVAGMVYKWFSEGRRHRWEVEQRQTMQQIRTDIQNGNGHT